MKRFTILLFTLFIFVVVFPFTAMGQPGDNQEVDISVEPADSEKASAAPALECQGAILIEQKTGKILFSKNADAKLFPASTTKILTALIAIEKGDLKEVVTVGNEANLTHRDGSKAGLDLKEEISLENLIRGLLLPSGNDAAYTIAVHIGRKVSNDPALPYMDALEKFIELMNQRAAELGAKNSHFVNPHGYHDDDHYTTPRDLALITQEAMKHQFFREVVKTTMFTIEDWNGVDKKDPSKKEIRYWRNKNELVQPKEKYYYEGATGVKTGYTSAAGHCLVSSATRNGLDLIAVVLNSSKEGKWTDSITLLDYGFSNYESREVINKGQLVFTAEVEDHAADDPGRLGIVTKHGFSSIFRIGDTERIKQKISWKAEYLAPTEQGTQDNSGEEKAEVVRFMAPISKGQILGTLILELDGEMLDRIDLVAARSVEKKKKVIERVIPSIQENSSWVPPWYWIVAGFVALLILLRIVAVIRRRRRRRYIYRRRY